MLIKDQFLLQHISYKVRGYFVADIFSANCDCFLRISPASHHNLSKDIIGIIIRSLWGLSDLSKDIIRMDSSKFQQKFSTLPAINSGDIIRIFWYQPRGSAYSFSSGCHMISYHQSFRRITSEFYYRDRCFSKFESGNASNRLALKDWGGCPQTCLFVIGARMPTWICCFFMKRLFVWLSGIMIITFSCENAAQDHPADKMLRIIQPRSMLYWDSIATKIKLKWLYQRRLAYRKVNIFVVPSLPNRRYANLQSNLSKRKTANVVFHSPSTQNAYSAIIIRKLNKP